METQPGHGADVQLTQQDGFDPIESINGKTIDYTRFLALRKHCAWSATRPELFYWRTASRQEVDIVLEDRSGKVMGIEVKAAATLGSNDVRGLRALADEVRKNWVRGVVLYAGEEVIPFSANAHAIP